MIYLNKVLCTPRWASLRDETSETEGDKLAQVARLLGFELFDWQQYVADVGLEKDQTGLYKYRTVAAQVGKMAKANLLKRVLLMNYCNLKDMWLIPPRIGIWLKVSGKNIY